MMPKDASLYMRLDEMKTMREESQMRMLLDITNDPLSSTLHTKLLKATTDNNKNVSFYFNTNTFFQNKT